MKNDFSTADILRGIEIAARVASGEKLSKADAAYEYNVAEITINRDLTWLRSEGIDIHSRKGNLFIEHKENDSFPNLSAIYISLKNQTGIITSINKLELLQKSSYKLIIIAKAISSKRFINISYTRFYDDENINYKLKPYELKLVGYNWVLKAVKDGEEILKSFYVSRIISISILEGVFEKEPAEEELEQYKIILRFSPDVKSQIMDKIWFDEFELSEDANGFIILKTNQPITNNLAAWCITWWDKIEVLENKKLHEYIKAMYKSFSGKQIIQFF